MINLSLDHRISYTLPSIAYLFDWSSAFGLIYVKIRYGGYKWEL